MAQDKCPLQQALLLWALLLYMGLNFTFFTLLFQTIVLEENSELAQHNVIVKLIDVKWKMIAKWQVVFDIGINLIHACIFTALTVAISFDSNSPMYSNLKESAWKIVLEILFVLITIYFVFKVSATFTSNIRNLLVKCLFIHGNR